MAAQPVFNGGKQMVGHHRHKDMGIGPIFLLMKIGSPSHGGLERIKTISIRLSMT
jgi:hypothetical protein